MLSVKVQQSEQKERGQETILYAVQNNWLVFYIMGKICFKWANKNNSQIILVL